MYNIEIICLGKLTNAYFSQAVAEYKKRLSAYCKLKFTELTEEKLDEKSSKDAIIARALDKEGKAILSAAKHADKLIALCPEGTMQSSEQLAEYLKKEGINGANDFVFVIGSSHGLSTEVKSAADLRLSMSLMTFPHELARVILTEQLYRAFSIINKGKYHK